MTETLLPEFGSDLGAQAPVFVLTDDLRLLEIGKSRFLSLVLERRIAHVAAFGWPTSMDSLDALGAAAHSTARSDHAQWAFADLSGALDDTCLVHARLLNGHLAVSVAADDRTAIASARAWLLERFPRAEATDAQEVPMQFWSESSDGASSRSRAIPVPTWDEIAANYPAAVASQLASLLALRCGDAHAGQLILWHGEPGLGKTYVLRALAWEWRDWCDVHYITDPEALFGRAEYMLDVLLDEEDEERWRLLVLEDTGELLTADAKERTGQGLSRFLNVVDGVIGQGLRVLVLVTTNEPVQRLHAAVSRPGRCAARVEFRAFSVAEATAWLAQHDVEAPEQPPRTLAGLFALADGHARVVDRPPVGFAG